MIIFLVGLPGCGKSTMGTKLAQKLDFNFLDFDSMIEKEQGKTISQIFSENGEAAFRLLENKTLHNLKLQTDTVISTGGGTPCFHNNMEIMNRMGVTVFIDTNVDEISRRFQKEDLEKRPMFNGLSFDQITTLLNNLRNKRLSFYTKSKFTLSENTLSLSELIDKLKD